MNKGHSIHSSKFIFPPHAQKEREGGKDDNDIYPNTHTPSC